MPVFLNGLATAVPEYELPQNLVEENARRILGPRYKQFERMVSTFKTSGVEKRYSFAPLEWFHEPQDWKSRNDQYLNGGQMLFTDVAKKALKSANLEANQIDAVVTVSSTGVATPTLEALAFKDMGFREDINRIPVFGLGCAGGASGLSIAHSLAKASPGKNVLLVILEACSLSFRSDRLQKADIIATVLFGDGAAAACLSSQPSNGQLPSISLQEGSEHLWPDTLGIMGWDVDNVGLGVVFDRSIPSFADEHMASVVETALQKADMKKSDIGRFVFHPGGAKVVDALENALELEPGCLDAERDVLREYGNMSAPTILFVLEKVVASNHSGPMMLGALGPGFTASSCQFT